jgi:AbrB family looped-hinge helix DNA binding protein
MMTVKLSSKGQLVIPKPIREALGLKKGTRFHVDVAEGKIILDPDTASPIDALYGKYAEADLLSDLEEEHRQELQHDVTLRP